ncbi:hypothetical protein HaLaN_07362, partial [Haematococcus lacustris]
MAPADVMVKAAASTFSRDWFFEYNSNVLELVPAIMAMVNGENWPRLRQSSTNAAVFEKFMIPTWYKCLKLVIKLMKPISNAIHRLEADAPYLSQ